MNKPPVFNYADYEQLQQKYTQAMELIGLAVEDLSEYKRCLKCKNHKNNYGDCIGMNACQKSEYHEKWQWQHADKLEELRGGSNIGKTDT